MYKPLPKNVTIKTSSIHGLGLFANEGISKNTALGISHVSHDCFENGWIRTPLGGFYNHSEKPNCEIIDADLDVDFGKENTSIKILRTIRNIDIDEELTCIYTIWDIKDMKELYKI